MDTFDPNEAKFTALREDLHRRYGHALPAADIDRALDELIDGHKAQAKVHDFLPIIVEREVTEELEGRAWGDGGATRRQEILFVCEHNTGRSQIASVIARHYAGDQALIRSVGPRPQPIGNEGIERLLRERGFDTSLVYPKELTSRTIHESDVVILIGGDELDAYRANAAEVWDVPDPELMDDVEVSAVIDDIAARVLNLLEARGLDVG